MLAARHFLISKVLAARMRKLITARARKNYKRTACMPANARKDQFDTPSVNFYSFVYALFNRHVSYEL